MHEELSYETYQGIAEKIKSVWPEQAYAVLLLGTGLGGLAERMSVQARIPYQELPGMPIATAESHAGDLVCGTLGGKSVIGFSGRLHCYEGHSAAAVIAPVRVAQALGIEHLIMGSAVGGLNTAYQVGDVAIINDHINLMGVNPLVGPNDERMGPRWPDMFETYSMKHLQLAQAQAERLHINLHSGVYAAVLGPNLETRAEYAMLQKLGADMVGMSTVPEAIAAVHARMKTLAFAIITDLCLPESLEPADVQKIIAAANKAEPVLSDLIIACLEQME